MKSEMSNILCKEILLVGNLLNDWDLAPRPVLPETLPVTRPRLEVGVIEVLTLDLGFTVVWLVVDLFFL